MNYQDCLEARKCFDRIAEFCDTVDDSGLLKVLEGKDIKLRDVLRLDVADFIMYLSASDGYLSREEVEAYRTITGYGGDDVSSITEHIKENHIYSMDFESEPPLIMKLLSEAERKAIYRGAPIKTSVLKAVVLLFELIADIIVSIDGGITYTEKRDREIIMSTIKGYAQDHDISGNNQSLLN